MIPQGYSDPLCQPTSSRIQHSCSWAALARLSACPETPQLGEETQRGLRRDAEDGRALHHRQLWALTGACRTLPCYGFEIPVLTEPSCQSSSAPSGLSVQEEEDIWDDCAALPAEMRSSAQRQCSKTPLRYSRRRQEHRKNTGHCFPPLGKPCCPSNPLDPWAEEVSPASVALRRSTQRRLPMHHPGGHAGAPVSLPSVFPPALPVTGRGGGRTGGRARRSQGEAGGEREAQRVREVVQPSVFCLSRAASSSPGNSTGRALRAAAGWGRDGGFHPSSLQGSKQAEHLGNVFGGPSTHPGAQDSFALKAEEAMLSQDLWHGAGTQPGTSLCRFVTSGSVPGQAGRIPEPADLVSAIPAHVRGLGRRGPLGTGGTGGCGAEPGILYPSYRDGLCDK